MKIIKNVVGLALFLGVLVFIAAVVAEPVAEKAINELA